MDEHTSLRTNGRACDPALPVVGYRMAGDLEIRAAEVQQELAYARAELREAQREVYATRRVLRLYAGLSMVSKGGLGATLATLAVLVLYAFEVVSGVAPLAIFVISGFVFGTLLSLNGGARDDGFPPAPPPRLR